MTGWRRRVDGGGWAEGQGIVPMNLKEAREWAERCLTTAQVEAAFGDTSKMPEGQRGRWGIVTGYGSRDVGQTRHYVVPRAANPPCRHRNVRARASIPHGPGS